jgi:hypothetical protein
MSSERSCATCVYADNAKGTHPFPCRRYPPVRTEYDNGGGPYDAWVCPEVGPRDWCGEWRPKGSRIPAHRYPWEATDAEV